ncbi:Bug family tripartite tricarboxylate transporter substrate binding protein [Ramlibacter rhizophilus]|uniref:Tripartite tricarboxylate transporter substrate binding protein n=1 Tax=Ramlibacter rhizophilus TaxID=1781167 RepID=A0A4Z0BDQ5_9BURK|nr:tripartite tricarboxylate transporter substrate binding protein [Ramlibacter rhizophilus]TFY97436.1 tripartite tricarboxylate transporter substrate binding protein [Ramlibacter rhizophilus]
MIKQLARALLVGAALAVASLAGAQDWPDRPLKLVVPYTAGGQFDVVARMVAERMQRTLGQPVVVENKPGGATLLGADYVAKSKPDGYTLFYAGANAFAIAPHLFAKVPFQRGDFETISLVSELPMGLVVSGQLPVRTLEEFVAYAKANPGKVNFGTSGSGGAQHLLCELVKDRAGIDMVHVGYKGTSQVLQDLLPGRVSAACDGLLAYAPHAKAGAVRILAVSSAKRLPALPDVPTFAEKGLPDATVASWGGIMVPAGVPAPVRARLVEAVTAAASAPEVQQRIASDAAVPRTTTPEEFDAVIRADHEKWGDVIRKLGLAGSK